MNIELINEIQYEDTITQILHNRGIDNPEEFFNIDWDCVQDPTALDNMEAGAKLLEKHLSAGNKIAVIVDCDCDGFTSSALLLNYLHEEIPYMFPDNLDYQKNIVYMFHEGKDHGLSDATLMRRIRDEVKPQLVIIPDASGSYDQYMALVNLGMDILVLDHHDVERMILPDNVIVINNMISDNYKNKSLSGVGVVWQFCRYLDANWVDIDVNRYLGIVAIGMVADVMDLRSDETRFLVLNGLAIDESNFTRNSKFKFSYQLKDKYNPTSIGFVIGPLFNSICRIGSMEEKELTFKALLEYENAQMVKDGTRGHTGEVELVMEALRQMSNCKGRQDTRKKKLTQKIDDAISEQGLAKNKIICVKIDDFDTDQRAMSGLICNMLIDIYQRPIVLLFKNPDGSYAGSVRSPENSKVFENFKDQCNDTGLCRFASGHQAAFGIAFDHDKVEPFIEHFNDKYGDVKVEPYYRVDYIFDASDKEAFNKCLDMSSLEDVYGQGIKEPLVAFTNVKLQRNQMALFKPEGPCPTLKIHTLTGIDFIKFYSNQDEFRSLKVPYEGGAEQFYTATIVGTCSANTFRGVTAPQINIVDYEVNDIVYDF